MEVLKANETHIPAIIAIAVDSWNATYQGIITQQQIDYMLELFYTEETLCAQMQLSSNHFWIVRHEDVICGYAQIIENENDANTVKLSKLYVLPAFHQKGIGRLLLTVIEQQCRDTGRTCVTLNVNRNNPAKDFYIKSGFEIIETVDIPLNKYWLNDYIMQKDLSS